VTSSSWAALFALGLRPFYLAAAIFAALAVPAWYAAYRGWLIIGGAFPALAWHSHEMLFGFAPAVIAGFLLAAVRNWTNLPTPSGGTLAGLLALWLAGRICMLIAPAVPAMLVDAAFLPVLAVLLAQPIWRSRNLRNLFIPGILLLLAGANAVFHLAYHGTLPVSVASIAIRVAADTLACLMAVIAGRVIPAFAANAIKGLAPRRWPALEAIALGLLVLIVLLDCASAWEQPPAELSRLLILLAGTAHAVRLAGWKPWAMRHNLLLVILPISYGWIPIYLVLRAWLAAPGLPGLDLQPLALHALVIGAMGSLMLAMMTRSALGHTARALLATRREAGIYLAMQGAAVTRVLLPLAAPAAYGLWAGIASVLWTVAFATFAVGYWRMLSSPRLDGRPG